MPVVPFTAFLGSAYRSASVNVATSELCNWFLEPTESKSDQTFPAALLPTPGTVAFTENLAGPIRGEFSQDGRAFTVGGDTLYENHGNGTATVRGRVAQDDQPASMSSNGHGGHQLCIASGGNGYIFDLNTSVFQQITSAGFPSGAVMVDYIDGRFAVLQATTDKVFLSDLFNGLGWNGLSVLQVSSSSDSLMAIRVIQRNMWTIGAQRSEVWVTTPASSILEPLGGGLIEYGIAAVWSLAEADSTLLFVGKDERGSAVVVQTSGYGVKRISTFSEERHLSLLPDLANVRGYTYQENGHTFYVVTPNTGPALVYNLATGLWATRGRWNTGSQAYDPPAAWCHMFAFGKHLVGDRTTGTIYDQSLAYGTDNGIRIRRVRRCPHINDKFQWVFLSEVTIGAETGLSVDAGDVLSLCYSKDGGHVYSTPVDISFGALGQYDHLMRWHRYNVRFADFVLEASTTALCAPRLNSCFLRLEGGTGQR